MKAFNMLFILHCIVCTVSKNVYHSVKMFGESALANQYKYEVEIRNNRKKLTSVEDVAPLGCKTLEEDLSVPDNIDTIINFLGDSKDIIVKIHIGRNCIKCNTFISKCWQPTNKGWYCQDCASTRRLCKYSSKGCTYKEIDKKTEKHELFFCQFGTWCEICKRDVDPHNTHYTNVHSDDTYEAGTSWRAPVLEVNVLKCAFMNSEVGNLFCRYLLTDTEFLLAVRAPLHTEQLSNYKCIVKLINPTAEFTTRKTLEFDYDNWWDWRVGIPKDEFLMYVCNNEFNIKIGMIKIETCC